MSGEKAVTTRVVGKEYKVKTLLSISEELKTLPPKEPEERKVKGLDALSIMLDGIAAAKKQGYTLEEVEAHLISRSVIFSKSTLKNFWKNEVVSKPKQRKITSAKRVKDDAP